MSVAGAVERFVARRLFRLPHGLQVRLSGRPPVVMDGRALEPEVQLMLRLRQLRGRENGLRAESVERARALFRAETSRFSVSPLPVHAFDRVIPTPDAQLLARHYVPEETSKNAALLVFFHGGGFVIGDLDTHDDPCRLIADQARIHVLSVDYRLAPEHPFPAAVEDAAAALLWALEHAEELGADPARVGVGGDSAGGNLAAVATQQGAARGKAPAFQVLIYPTTDVAERRPSKERFSKGFILTQADMDWAHEHYFGNDPRVVNDPRLSPLRAPDLSGLPPALVVTAGYDPLRDDGDAYAEALRKAGNHVNHVQLGGFVHGFLHMVGVSPAAENAVRRIADEVRRMTQV